MDELVDDWVNGLVCGLIEVGEWLIGWIGDDWVNGLVDGLVYR